MFSIKPAPFLQTRPGPYHRPPGPYLIRMRRTDLVKKVDWRNVLSNGCTPLLNACTWNPSGGRYPPLSGTSWLHYRPYQDCCRPVSATLPSRPPGRPLPPQRQSAPLPGGALRPLPQSFLPTPRGGLPPPSPTLPCPRR